MEGAVFAREGGVEERDDIAVRGQDGAAEAVGYGFAGGKTGDGVWVGHFGVARDDMMWDRYFLVVLVIDCVSVSAVSAA